VLLGFADLSSEETDAMDSIASPRICFISKSTSSISDTFVNVCRTPARAAVASMLLGGANFRRLISPIVRARIIARFRPWPFDRFSFDPAKFSCAKDSCTPLMIIVEQLGKERTSRLKTPFSIFESKLSAARVLTLQIGWLSLETINSIRSSSEAILNQ
jgi:hypothetical protein